MFPKEVFVFSLPGRERREAVEIGGMVVEGMKLERKKVREGGGRKMGRRRIEKEGLKQETGGQCKERENILISSPLSRED